MANKLYPPVIDNILPAFVGNSIEVPFQLNRAVGRNEFDKVSIIVKTVSTGSIKVDGKTTSIINYNAKKKTYTAIFNLDEDFLIGQYYKIQIAFVSQNVVGYYSTVGIAKCTSKPQMFIKGLDVANEANLHTYQYTGVYSQKDTTDEKGNIIIKRDQTEKVYSYEFILYDEFGNLVASSGEQLHNASLDIEKDESTDSWIIDKTLIPNYQYSLTYKVKTLNNYEGSSETYHIMQYDTIDLERLDAKLHADLISEDGMIKISLIPNSDKVKNVSGHFILLRSSDEDKFESWHELTRFNLVNEAPKREDLWKDFTLQQGIKYKYAIQAYNKNNFYSNKMENIEGEIFVDFEDCFLFDGEKQLKIRFNPKISSFKTTILQNKVDTIGGKYPFIFRNGRVEYKEFPISGLITLISDENRYFRGNAKTPPWRARTPAMTKDQAARELFIMDYNDLNDIQKQKVLEYIENEIEETAPAALTALTGKNYYNERVFKLQVLDWLNDGKPKLFRSPAEGNYIVNLMNVSLSPIDSLGRMLHTFSATAYEVAEYNFSNLNRLNFINTIITNQPLPKFYSLSLSECFTEDNKVYNFTPHLPFKLMFSGIYNHNEVIIAFKTINNTIIEKDIGNITGQSNIELEEAALISMELKTEINLIPSDASLIFMYYDDMIESDISYIEKVTINNEIDKWIGKGYEYNLLSDVTDVRKKLGRFYQIKIELRPQLNIYTKDDINFYTDKDYQEKDKIIEWNKNWIYIVNDKENGWIDGREPEKINNFEVTPINYLACINNNLYSNLDKIPRSEKNRTSSSKIVLNDIDNLNYFSLGNGLYASTIIYQLKTFEYGIESNISELIKLKKQWLEAEPSEKYATYQKYIERLEIELQRLEGDLIYAV